jgi:twitching motility protein PilT
LNLKQLLKDTLSFNSSDLHIVSGVKPQIRVDKDLKPLQYSSLKDSDIQEMIYPIINDKQKKEFQESNELDFSFEIEDIGRFRANLYQTIDGMACAFRTIPLEIPTLERYNNNPILKQLIQKEKGLILITGSTGSGKSTTLASMLHEINLTQSKHIITIEDPVEFVHKNIKSLFSQRNIGDNTKSFATATKYALRQDPDIILIGEMRDAQTIKAALSAAETGHLVLSTLHTNSAVETIHRILDTFNAAEHSQVRSQLSTSLLAIVSQSLISKIGGGKISTQEILITNPAIKNLIREDKIHQIYSQMQLNQQETGMTTQTQELINLIKENLITKENAIKNSNKIEEFQKFLNKL